MLADGINEFDSMGVKGYRGSLWALVIPRSFRVKLNPGDSLLQSRFFNRNTRLDGDDELEMIYQKHKLLFDSKGRFIEYSEYDQIQVSGRSGALVLTINLESDIIGYRCEGSQEVLDFSKEQYYQPEDFFHPIPRPKNGSLTLRRGDFYIFATKEFFRVPMELAAEVVPITTRMGDYRVHYAGYFDPGWGLGSDASLNGAPAVLEMRSFEDNLPFDDGQAICKVEFERMAEVPEVVYGQTGSHYLRQTGLRLSKHFKV
jgi:dCTP deaminase